MQKRLIIGAALALIVINLISTFLMLQQTATLTVPLTGKASSSGEVQLCINRPPSITAIADQTGTEGTAFTLQVTATEPDGQTLTYYDNTSLFAIDQTGLISFTPSFDSAGTYSILITVQDSGCVQFNASDDFLLTIAEGTPPAEEGPAGGGGGGGGGGISIPPKDIGSLESITGTQRSSAREGQIIIFTYKGITHTIHLDKLGVDSARITVASLPQTVTLLQGEYEEFDLDEDKVADVRIQLDLIQDKQAYFLISYLRESFYISDEILKVNVRKSELLEKKVTVTNDGQINLDLRIENPMENLLTITPSLFTLSKELNELLSFTFNPSKDAIPDVYSRTITFTGTQGLRLHNEYMVVVLEVETDKVLFDGNIDLTKESYFPGEEMAATVSIFNLGKESSANLTLMYDITDLQGKQWYTLEEAITLEQQASFSKVIPLPPDILPGQYVLALKIPYQDSFATSTELFTVEAPAPAAPRPSALAGLAARIAGKPVFVLAVPAMLMLIVGIVIILVHLHKRSRRLEKTHATIKQKAIESKVQDIHDASRLQQKLNLLTESYHKGYIKEETYLETKAKIEKLLQKRG
ncbi:MAG: Dystroglycan-type cadherin-like protein [archaeon GW2011_AR9]|nr:MAG: Dystroglycan-type cadherin-like protein [archaeon GW2011_AR9]